MMKYIVCVFVGIIFFMGGCSSNNSNQSQILILPYSAFGPYTMSGSLLGVEWFQWQLRNTMMPIAQYHSSRSLFCLPVDLSKI